MHEFGVGRGVEKTPMKPLPQLKIGKAATLGELTKEFTPFSLGLLATKLPLDSHPYEDFCHETGRSGVLAPLRFGHVIFSGLCGQYGDVSWERGLFLLAIEDWEPFSSWLASLVVVDPAVGAKFATRVRLQQVQIYDPIVIARKARHLADANPPLVSVWATALERPDGCWYFNKKLPPEAIFDPLLRFDDTLDFGGARLLTPESRHGEDL